MAALDGLEDYIREQVEKQHMIHARLSSRLQELYPGVRGFSIRSLERFCNAKNIHKTARPSAQQVDNAVSSVITQVIHYCTCLYSSHSSKRLKLAENLLNNNISSDVKRTARLLASEEEHESDDEPEATSQGGYFCLL